MKKTLGRFQIQCNGIFDGDGFQHTGFEIILSWNTYNKLWLNGLNPCPIKKSHSITLWVQWPSIEFNSYTNQFQQNYEDKE